MMLRSMRLRPRWMAMALATMIAPLAWTGCGGNAEDSDSQPAERAPSARLKVAVSFFPLFEFATRVGGEHVEVTMIVPPGVEPHSFEPSPGEIRLLSGMDVIIYNGAGMEPWLEQVIERARTDRAIIVNASDGLQLIAADEEDAEHDTHDHEGEHEHGRFNPHTWLDPLNAIQQAGAIQTALARAAPDRAEEFAANAARIEAELTELDKRIREALSGCSKRDVVITHASLSYFCRRYGLTEIPISGLAHQSEPSPRSLARLTELARERGVGAVFHEREISPRLANVVAREINGVVLEFDTLHSGRPDDLEAGRGYAAVMTENLANLCKGLECDCE